ncbi:MAG: HEAT repeat domain-containing protein, partial [Candidatus Wukongarchaeota archaeon]|nr:HEAT repeat domain-containing protein [Candidatus Wukongarchaeota archaeon]
MGKSKDNSAKRKNDPSEKVEELIKVLREGKFELRVKAAKNLGEIGDPRAIDPLVKTMKEVEENLELVGGFDDDLERFLNSLRWALSHIRGPKAIAPLIKVFKTTDGNIQVAASDALARIGKPAVEPLIKLLNHKEFYVRWQAVRALQNIGDKRAFEPLLKALNDENGEVRWKAAETLGKMRDKKAADHLIKALEDEDERVRMNAMMALFEIGDTRAVEPLIRMVKGELVSPLWHDGYFHHEAIEALGKMRAKKAVEPLIQALDDSETNVRTRAAEALGMIKDPRAVEPLIEHLSKWPEGSDAAWALGEIGDERAVEHLTQALKDDSAPVRRQSAEALDKLGGKPGDDTEKVHYLFAKKQWDELVRFGKLAVEPLIKALKDRDDKVVEKAAWALGEIGDERAVGP